MILEFLEHLITPASYHAKKFGYLHQSIALRKRYERNSLAWQPHLENCRTVIENCLQTKGKDQKVLVLGSGLLLETPIDLLLEKFDEVHLLDAFHPKSVRTLAVHSNAIKLIEEDLNGFFFRELGYSHLESSTNFADYDFIISANVLSQLPLFPIQWAARSKSMQEGDLSKMIMAIFTNHLENLRKAKSGALLFTDVQREYLDRNSHVVRIEPSLLDFEMPIAMAEWVWNLAPIPEFSRSEALQLRVRAFSI